MGDLAINPNAIPKFAILSKEKIILDQIILYRNMLYFNSINQSTATISASLITNSASVNPYDTSINSLFNIKITISFLSFISKNTTFKLTTFVLNSASASDYFYDTACCTLSSSSNIKISNLGIKPTIKCSIKSGYIIIDSSHSNFYPADNLTILLSNIRSFNKPINFNYQLHFIYLNTLLFDQSILQNNQVFTLRPVSFIAFNVKEANDNNKLFANSQYQLQFDFTLNNSLNQEVIVIIQHNNWSLNSKVNFIQSTCNLDFSRNTTQ